MSRNNKKKTKVIDLDKKKDASFWFAMFVLVIMIFGTVGFSLGGGGGSSSDSSEDLPSEVPFQQFEQDGNVFWGAIKNSEQFVFSSIEGYEGAIVEKGIAKKLESKKYVEVYVDDGFNQSSAVFLIEKALRGVKIESSKVDEFSCDENTLVFTTKSDIEGDCVKFVSNNEDAYEKAQIVTYHMIKE